MMKHKSPLRMRGFFYNLVLSKLNSLKTTFMKSAKYLNGILTVIAFCLVLISMSLIGVIPQAKANDGNGRYVTVPVNSDGSINVKLNAQSPMDVNIASCEPRAFNRVQPIMVKIKE